LKGVQCFQRITLLQERVFRTVQQLQGLQRKLDFAYAAVSELDVQMQIFGPYNIAFNSRLEFRDFVEEIWRNSSGKNERLQVLTKLIEQFAGSCESPGLYEGHASPGLAVAGIIIFDTVKRANKRAM